MIMMIILVLGVVTVLVSSFNSSAVNIERDKTTAQALAQAREALIGYAVTYADTHSNTVPGYLPCPDRSGTGGSTGEGSSDTCSGTDISTLGRLPWRTLGLEPLRDGYGECLWYAVSGTYQNNPKTDMMNWDTRGLLKVSDANGNSMSDVVAVIFAPGPPLTGQDRAASSPATAPTCGGNYTASNYLDSDGTHDNSAVSGNASATSSFYSGTSSQMNDKLIYITRQDIWNAMLKRNDFMTTLKTMTQKAAECIADYGKRNYRYVQWPHVDKRLPWSGRFYPSSSDYKTDSSYDDEDNRNAGRLPYRVNTSDSQTSNYINSPYYQLTSDGDNCPDVKDSHGHKDWPNYYPWWTNWKDHLYYAVSSSFDPDASIYSSWSGWHAPHCGTCVEVNGTEYAAVVIFAGQALSGQSRATDADHLSASNYLEGSNLTNINNSSYGGGTYVNGTDLSSNPGTTNDDVLYCIKEDLSVVACP
jgi:hypothetical protein